MSVKKRILVCVGTRPEWIKIKPIIIKNEEMGNPIRFDLLFTGQHENIIKDKDFSPSYSVYIEKGINRLNSIFSSILKESDIIFKDNSFDYIMVQGDTSSALALAISAFHHGIKIIHLEAGLRTNDVKNPYPEEFNRQAISKISDIHFCPTKGNLENLNKEGIFKNAFVVGNTSLDNIKNTETSEDNIVLVTMHRRENQEIMNLWFNSIESISSKYKELSFILPLHPNPEVSKLKGLLKNVNVIDPLEHSDLIVILSKAKICITDSGGIQEEASFLKKKTIVCRKITERVESIGQSGILCKRPEDLEEAFVSMLNSPDIKGECPYGDGDASEKIIKNLILC